MDALEPFATSGMPNDTAPLPYLDEGYRQSHYAINLSSSLTPRPGQATIIGQTSATNLLFSFPQMLAHHTIGGCPFNVGDLMGSGTISGTSKDSTGALLERTDNGKTPLALKGGETRTFIEDGDTVTLSGVCGGEDGALVGFGECVGRIEPAIEFSFGSKR